MHSSPERKGTLDVKRGLAIIDQLGELGCACIVFAGGEPTLLKQDLVALLERAAHHGIATRMVSNASWAKTSTTARRKLQELRSAGLDEVNISVDDFHLPYIPTENLKTVFDASMGLGFSSFTYACCIYAGSELNPEKLQIILDTTLPVHTNGDGDYKARTIRGTAYSIYVNHLTHVGRARQMISEDALITSTARARHSHGPCLTAMRDIAISPRGTLLPCCGAEYNENEHMDLGLIGDNLGEMVEQATRTPLMRIINHGGPSFLGKVLSNHGYSCGSNQKHASICDVCEKLFTDPIASRAIHEASDELKAVADALDYRRMNRRQPEEVV